MYDAPDGKFVKEFGLVEQGGNALLIEFIVKAPRNLKKSLRKFIID